ncbi:MAG: hypothetical protein LBL00_02690, partial [Endomicrobium sp.]|nr:hypothetical protein [Endomicrobium sp.]
MKKFIAVLTALFFTYGIVSQPLFAAMPPQVLTAPKILSIGEPVISYSFGKINAAALFGDLSSQKKIIINIQDLHCNPRVQRNIAAILNELETKYGLNAIYCEGAYSDIKTDWLNDIDKDKRQAVVDALLDSGRLSAGEYYCAVSENKTIKGLEDAKIHGANLVKFGNILENQNHYKRQIQLLDKELALLINKYFNFKNRRFNELSKRYKSGRISANKYYSALVKYINEANKGEDKYDSIYYINLDAYPNVKRYIAINGMTRLLNYRQITAQMRLFIKELKEKIPYSAYSALLEKTKNFENLNDLYVYVPALLKDYNIVLDDSKSDLKLFFDYVQREKDLNPLELIKEEKRLIEKIRLGLSEDKSELEISFAADFYEYLKDYLSASISSDDYKYFKEKFALFKSVWEKYTYESALNSPEIDFKEINEFYDTNFKRDEIFSEKLSIQKAGNTQKTDAASITAQELAGILKNAEISAVVTGGFHSEGLQNICEQNNVSYITITPNVAGFEDSNHIYTELAKRQAKQLSSEAKQATNKKDVQPADISKNAISLALGSNNAKIEFKNGNATVYFNGETLNLKWDGQKFDLDEISIDTPDETGKTNIFTPKVLLDIRSNIETISKMLTAAADPELFLLITEKLAAAAVDKGFLTGNGLIFEIANNEDLQTLIRKNKNINLNQLSSLPDFLQYLIAANLEKKADRTLPIKAIQQRYTNNALITALLSMPKFQTYILREFTVIKGNVMHILSPEDEFDKDAVENAIAKFFNEDASPKFTGPVAVVTDPDIAEKSQKIADFYNELAEIVKDDNGALIAPQFWHFSIGFMPDLVLLNEPLETQVLEDIKKTIPQEFYEIISQVKGKMECQAYLNADGIVIVQITNKEVIDSVNKAKRLFKNIPGWQSNENILHFTIYRPQKGIPSNEVKRKILELLNKFNSDNPLSNLDFSFNNVKYGQLTSIGTENDKTYSETSKTQIENTESSAQVKLTMAWLKWIFKTFNFSPETQNKWIKIIETPIMVLGAYFPLVQKIFLLLHDKSDRKDLEQALNKINRHTKNAFIAASSKIKFPIIKQIANFAVKVRSAFARNTELHLEFNKNKLDKFEKKFANDDIGNIKKNLYSNLDKMDNTLEDFSKAFNNASVVSWLKAFLRRNLNDYENEIRKINEYLNEKKPGYKIEVIKTIEDGTHRFDIKIFFENDVEYRDSFSFDRYGNEKINGIEEKISSVDLSKFVSYQEAIEIQDIIKNQNKNSAVKLLEKKNQNLDLAFYIFFHFYNDNGFIKKILENNNVVSEIKLYAYLVAQVKDIEISDKTRNELQKQSGILIKREMLTADFKKLTSLVNDQIFKDEIAVSYHAAVLISFLQVYPEKTISKELFEKILKAQILKGSQTPSSTLRNYGYLYLSRSGEISSVFAHEIGHNLLDDYLGWGLNLNDKSKITINWGSKEGKTFQIIREFQAELTAHIVNILNGGINKALRNKWYADKLKGWNYKTDILKDDPHVIGFAALYFLNDILDLNKIQNGINLIKAIENTVSPLLREPADPFSIYNYIIELIREYGNISKIDVSKTIKYLEEQKPTDIESEEIFYFPKLDEIPQEYKITDTISNETYKHELSKYEQIAEKAEKKGYTGWKRHFYIAFKESPESLLPNFVAKHYPNGIIKDDAYKTRRIGDVFIKAFSAAGLALGIAIPFTFPLAFVFAAPLALVSGVILMFAFDILTHAVYNAIVSSDAR